jgi:hypothetical protein
MFADVIAPPEKGQLAVWLFVMVTSSGIYAHKANSTFCQVS